MTINLTVRDVSVIFRKSHWTIRRWIQEGRKMTFDGFDYLPEKDPAGNWLIKKMKLIEHDAAIDSSVK